MEKLFSPDGNVSWSTTLSTLADVAVRVKTSLFTRKRALAAAAKHFFLHSLFTAAAKQLNMAK